MRYCLPRRRAPQARLLGAVGVAVFGLPLVWGVTIWMARSCDGGGAAVLVVIGLLITSSVLVNVLFHFMGRAEVELGGGELRAIERSRAIPQVAPAPRRSCESPGGWAPDFACR